MSTPESIRTDKAKVATQSVVIVGAADGVFLAADPNRVAITILAPPTNTITISSANPAVALAGVNIRTTDAPVTLRIEDLGNWITGALRAIGSVGNQNVAVIAVTSTAG